MKVKDYWSILVEAGCLICVRPAEIHHACGGSMRDRGIYKGKGSKTSDWLVLPLCPDHHRQENGFDTLGVHTWEAEFGKQADFIDMLCESTGMDLWEMAKEDLTTRRKKKYNRPSKILPRN